MAAVEFVYERSCPHVRDARARLIEAFRAAGLRPSWTEWEINEPATPERVRPLGSPTILVDGKDVSGLPLEEVSSCCRIYALEGHERGVPPLDQIVAALTRDAEPEATDEAPVAAAATADAGQGAAPRRGWWQRTFGA